MHSKNLRVTTSRAQYSHLGKTITFPCLHGNFENSLIQKPHIVCRENVSSPPGSFFSACTQEGFKYLLLNQMWCFLLLQKNTHKIQLLIIIIIKIIIIITTAMKPLKLNLSSFSTCFSYFFHFLPVRPQNLDVCVIPGQVSTNEIM